MVLLRETNLPSMQWALGRIIKVYTGSDGIIHTVTVKTGTTIFDRSVKILVSLLYQFEEEIEKAAPYEENIADNTIT
ncbi:hypothetical protein ANTPLA_LOCUS2938 [Anthophora plagiata]